MFTSLSRLWMLQVVLCLFFLALPIASAHEDCGSHWEVNDADWELDGRDERQVFGRRIQDMTATDFSDVHNSILPPNTRRTAFFNRNRDGSSKSRVQTENAFQLVGVPVVFHLLPNHNTGAEGSPSLTDLQRDYLVNRTNELFHIYDKQSKTTVQFLSIVSNGTIIHEDVDNTNGCFSMRGDTLKSIIEAAAEWQFKFHVLICESGIWSGFAAGRPNWFAPDNVQHNLIGLDYRAVACFNYETGEFLCDNYDAQGNPISHVRWWRNRSGIMSHEFGHLLGLFHVHFGGCLVGDGVPDTPYLSDNNYDDCPGLLPYDKDRDLFDRSQRQVLNSGANEDVCFGAENVCGSQCAACCERDSIWPPWAQCTKEYGKEASVTEDDVNFPVCCTRRQDQRPSDSCIFRPGIDPKNNIMAYVPDWCTYEFTTGQMAKMMAQTRTNKAYIFCNYASNTDDEICSGIPCASTATGTNCNS